VRGTVTETIEVIIRHLLDSLGEGVIFFDPADRVVWTNGTFEVMRGSLSSGSLIGRSIFDCHPAKDHGRVSQILNELKTGREPTRYHRARRSGIVGADQESQYDIFYTAVTNAAGDYLGTAMIIRDTREIKNLQDQVQRSEKRYRDIVENIDSGIFSLNDQGRITYANNGLLAMLGHNLNEMTHRLWIELFRPELRIEAERMLNTVLSREKGRVFETELVRRDGRAIHALVNLSPLSATAEDPSVIRGIVTDITAQKELERETLQRERFQGVIEMAGAACHHLNQPLTNILMRVQMLLKEMDREDPQYRFLEILEREAIRMGNVTRKIQNITRYETEPYVEGRSRIIDLERATGKK
jgi:PAS domain S-box-containing protein